MDKEGQSREIGVIHVRNFQAQMACNIVPSPSKKSLLRQFDVFFSLKVLGLVVVESVFCMGIWYHYRPPECCQWSLHIRALMIKKADLNPPSPDTCNLCINTTYISALTPVASNTLVCWYLQYIFNSGVPSQKERHIFQVDSHLCTSLDECFADRKFHECKWI